MHSSQFFSIGRYFFYTASFLYQPGGLEPIFIIDIMVFQQMVDDDKDFPGKGNDGFLGAAALLDFPIEL